MNGPRFGDFEFQTVVDTYDPRFADLHPRDLRHGLSMQVQYFHDCQQPARHLETLWIGGDQLQRLGTIEPVRPRTSTRRRPSQALGRLSHPPNALAHPIHVGRRG